MRVVPFGPSRHLAGVEASSGHLPFPLSHLRVRFTFSGTVALAQAARTLKLTPGDEILCPSYNCGHEVEPLLREGASVRSYRVDRDMQADLEDLERHIGPRTRAVLVTHYFGFPQAIESIREICDRRSVYLIEDCAHAFLGRGPSGPLGSRGDLAIFSFRKMMPLANGGALVLNNSCLEPGGPLVRPHPLNTWAKTLKLYKHRLRDAPSPWAQLGSLAVLPLLVARRLAGKFGGLAGYDPDDERFDFDGRLLEWAMAESARQRLLDSDFFEVVRRRRANYETLLMALDGMERLRPVIDTLPDAVCPLFFPVLAYNRSALLWELHRRGVHAAPWWEQFHAAIAWEEHPDAVFLKDHVVVLPVHQGIGPEALQHMIEALRSSRSR